MKNLVLIALPLFVFSSCRKDKTSEPPIIPSKFELTWQKAVGGSSSDQLRAITRATNGGYVMVGETYSSDGDLSGIHNGQALATWMISVDSNGNKLWSNTIPHVPSVGPHYITPSADGGYFITTHTYTEWLNHDIVYGKIKANGDTAWFRTIKGSKHDIVNSIIGTSDGGVLIIGFAQVADGDYTSIPGASSYFESWVAKINSSGNILWLKPSFGGKFITADSTGGYVLMNDNFLYKIDENGSMLWQKPVYLKRTYYESFIRSNDGGYIGVGYTSVKYDRNGEERPNDDVAIVKIDGEGNVVWEKKFGGSQSDYGQAVTPTHNGYIISAYTYSSDGDVDGNASQPNAWLFKVNDNGQMIWSTNLGDRFSHIYSLTPLGGDRFAGCGENASDGWIFKFRDIPL